MEDILAPRYIDPVAARKHLEALRWPDGPVCPHCGSFKAKRLEGKSHRDGLIQCNDCREQYTVTVGTVFERSKIALNKWLLCNHLMVSSKKGMSAHQIHRMLGVTYKTAWFMCHRLRLAMKDDGSPLGGPGKTVEIDETSIGGTAHGSNGGRYAGDKHMVLGMLEKGGELITRVVQNVKMHSLVPVVQEHVLPGTHIHTDALPSYQHLGKLGYQHSKVRHQWKEWVGSEGQTVNHIEGFWNILKRGINGTYIHVSEKHLPKYLGEFEYRWNMRAVPHLMLDRLLYSFVR